MTRTTINTLALLGLGLTVSQSGWAQDSADFSLQNSYVDLQMLPTGDGTCTLEVEAYTLITSLPSSPEVDFEVESIVVTGGEQTIVFSGSLYDEGEGCEEADGTLTCASASMMIADGIYFTPDGTVVGYFEYEFEFYASVSAPTGPSTYEVYQETTTPTGDVLKQQEQVTLDCPCSYRWDLNGDGLVSIADYLELLAIYGTSVDPDTGLDVDGDGTIASPELLDFLTQFGSSCETNEEPDLKVKSVPVRRHIRR